MVGREVGIGTDRQRGWEEAVRLTVGQEKKLWSKEKRSEKGTWGEVGGRTGRGNRRESWK